MEGGEKVLCELVLKLEAVPRRRPCSRRLCYVQRQRHVPIKVSKFVRSRDQRFGEVIASKHITSSLVLSCTSNGYDLSKD